MSTDNIQAPQGLLKHTTSGRWVSSDAHVLLTFEEGISNKFWGAIPDGNSFIIISGRNGRPPQQSQVVTYEVAAKRLLEKLNKGYGYFQSNKLLYAFNNAPEWFEKVQGSDTFRIIINAKILESHIEKTAPQPTAAKTKFKI